jgi:hypothetical protein
MKSKLIAIAGAVLFTLALEVSASAATYDVSGSWFIPADSFTGTLDVSGSSVTDPAIGLSGAGITGTVSLDNLVSAFKTGPFYAVTVNDGTSVGDYSLFIDFTLPNANNKGKGFLDLAELSEIVVVDVCNRFGKDCKDEDETKVLAILGLGSVTAGSIGGGSLATPLPATLSLFATGLMALGLFGWRKKLNSTAFTAAA